MLIAGAMVGVAALIIAVAPSLGHGPSTAAQEQQLNRKLLSVSDLPEGWRVVPPSSDVTATGLACLTGVTQSNAKVPVVAAGFASPTGVPNVIEVLEGYSSGARRGASTSSPASPSTGARARPSRRPRPVSGRPRSWCCPRSETSPRRSAEPTTGNTTSTVVVARTKGTVVYLVYETHGPADTNLLQLLAIRATAKAAKTP